MSHDVFICHASEDKDAIARPLAEALQKHNIDVWYDEFSLTIGDSLREAIDRGLASSRFAIVIISSHFFMKPWAKRELNGIVAREMNLRERLILPVWHDVSAEDVVNFSPPLADIRAANTSAGIDALAAVLLQSIRPGDQPLPIARATLERFGWDPPSFSDVWWLDMATLASDLEFEMFSRTFQFPIRHPAARTPRERGENIAWAALQAGWWDDAEERKICQITRPEHVLDFIRKTPELYDACKFDPGHFVGYVPQLLVPEFSAEFAPQFDDLLAKSEAKFKSDSLRSQSDENTVCEARFAFRHPTLGNHRPSRIVDKWLRGLKGAYNAELLPRGDYLFWLLSDDSNWMPSNIRQTLTQGMHDTPHWWFDFSRTPKKLADAFHTRRRTKLKWTKSLMEDLVSLAKDSCDRNGLKTKPQVIADRFIECDLVGGMDKWHEQVRARRRDKES